MTELISKASLLNHTVKKTDGVIELLTDAKHYVPNQVVDFRCKWHGPFSKRIDKMIEHIDKYPESNGCLSCLRLNNFNMLAKKLPTIERIALVLEKAQLKPDTDINEARLKHRTIFTCPHGHRTYNRFQDIESFVIEGKIGCSECRALEKNDWETRLFNNKQALKSVRHKHLLVSPVPVRRNCVVQFTCNHHGSQESSFSEYLKSEPCKQCASSGDIPLENFLLSKFKWRNYYV